ncbi:MAG TPA: hypothetical protein VEZ90_10020 [Blastocatellia bacterium]|nr:hypothetical protein [Blastocatellia bacterium]
MPEKISYLKEAFKEPANLWGMVLCAAATVYTYTVGHAELSWIVLAGGSAAETLYLATLPVTAGYRRIVERRARRRELIERAKRREELVKQFDPREREAVEYLRWQKNQIYQNYKKFTSMDTIPDNIQRLERIWEEFVDLLDMYRRRKNHLRSINRQMINNQIQQAERSVNTAPDDDTRRLYEKNLEILQKRMHTYDDIELSVKRVEAQLQSIESFFGLVNDQIVTMPTPELISGLDFDSLLSSIEMTKEILAQTAPVLSQLDTADRSAGPGLRPPLTLSQ